MKKFKITLNNKALDPEEQHLVTYENLVDFTHFSNGEVELYIENEEPKTVQLTENKTLTVELQ